jgi:hypothetical protein
MTTISNTTDNVVLSTKKSKNQKIKPAKLMNDLEFIIEEDVSFVPQIKRKDVLTNMLLNIKLIGSLLF